ncbi:unnamed protein product [Spirodela intermedia]|uniref:Uncharacterized protein n=1 Tax=Spirodela intermedia TaxID=51605 RepID=A0A7I8KST0_SPIIN|nr:unnamed protein product [Spirodela intermedia]
MAVSANPSGPPSHQTAGDGAAGGNSTDSNPAAAVAASDNSAPTQVLKHNPGLAAEWTPEEQSILEDGLTKYASEPSIIRFAKIAMLLSEKTVRDVALRSRWMTRKENGKRKKDDHNSSKKNNKKGVSDTSAKASQMATRPGVPPYPLLLPMDNDDEVSSKAIGGATGELLERNAQFFNQISANFVSYQVQENINLFCQIRDNIQTIINDMNESGVMDQMPALPKVNEELANSIMHTGSSMPMQS